MNQQKQIPAIRSILKKSQNRPSITEKFNTHLVSSLRDINIVKKQKEIIGVQSVQNICFREKKQQICPKVDQCLGDEEIISEDFKQTPFKGVHQKKSTCTLLDLLECQYSGWQTESQKNQKKLSIKVQNKFGSQKDTSNFSNQGSYDQKKKVQWNENVRINMSDFQ